MYAKIAISACRLVAHDRRQISSALMVLKNVSTIARQTICKANLPRGGGVVVTIALAGHGYLEAMLAQDLLIIVGTILAAPVGMVDAALWAVAGTRWPSTDRQGIAQQCPERFQRPDRQVPLHAVADGPADDAAGMQVQDDGEIQPAFARPDVTDIARPL